MNSVLYLISCRIKSRKLYNIVSVLVVAFSVSVIIIALSISNGFEKALIEKIIVAAPQITIFGAGDKFIMPENSLVKDIIDVAQVQALSINPENNEVQGVLLRGTDVNSIPKLFKNKSVMLHGVYPYPGEIIVGNKLAENSDLYVGDEVKILTGPAIFKEFKISGIFKVGLYDFDSTVAIAPYQDIIDFEPESGEGIASKVSIYKALWLNDPFKASEFSKKLMSVNDEIQVTNWQVDNKSLVQAISLEKKVIFIVLLLLVVASSVAIANSQFIQIISQQEQIAILSAVGFTANKISITFILESLLIGITGSIGGMLLSILVVYLLGSYPISLPMDIYQVEVIPIAFEIRDASLTVLAAIMMLCISAMVPAYYAAKLDPVEILRRV